MEAGLKKKNTSKTRWLKPLTAITLLTLTTLQTATQSIALRFDYHANLGEPLHEKLYAPWQVINWHLEFYTPYKEIFDQLYTLSATIILLIVAILISIIYVRKPKAIKELHGSAHWASQQEIETSGLLPKSNDGAVYVGGWQHPKTKETHYLRHSGKEHVLSIAPTRSGKGVGQVLPTLLSWQQSVVVYDIKGENWALTAGWRQQAGNKVMKFSPATNDGSSIKFNPLEEIRLGSDHEVADVQNIVSMIVDPDGKGLNDHWAKTGHALLVGTVLHLLYKGKKENFSVTLKSVSECLSDPDQPVAKLYEEMMTYAHTNNGTHSVVASCARDMLNKAENERSGVLSTAMSFLTLYRDPIVAENTSRSEFKISDLMNHENPVSLYLVVSPNDIDRLKPLIRLLINQILRTLVSKMEFKDGASVAHYKHKLLLMIDEFASLGRLEIFQQSLAFIAGYGIKAFLIIQDLSQLYAAYGKDENIVSNCHIRAAYAPNKTETARELSTMTGVTTVVKEEYSISGKRFSGSLNQVSKSIREHQRPLLTADECMRLPGATKTEDGLISEAGDMLIFASGHAPVYGKQILYFQDPTFSERSKIPAPATSDSLIEHQELSQAFKLETIPPKAEPTFNQEALPELNESASEPTFNDPDEYPEDPRYGSEPPAYNYDAQPEPQEDYSEPEEFPALPESTEEYPI